MVFIVDDGPDYRLLLRQVFNRFLPDYAVRFFAGGNELRQHIAAGGGRPRVILLDVNMPILNGFQRLAFIKQQPVWNQIPVVIMTSPVNNRAVVTCYKLGAGAFVPKPTDVYQMQRCLETVCRFWLDLNQSAEAA